MDNGPTLLDAATMLIAIVALLVSLAALVYARRATLANEEAAKATRRTADVAERTEQQERVDADATAVRWRLEQVAAGVNGLRNVGDGVAYDVRVHVPPDIAVLGLPTEKGEVGPGSMMRVGAAADAGTVDDTVRVYWRNSPQGPEREWSHPAV